MTDCLFLLADANMKSMFEGFLERQKFFASLKCGEFSWKTRHWQGDPALFRDAPDLLRDFQSSAKRAVVVLDAEWDTPLDSAAIASNLTQRLLATGWAKDAVQVIVIDPELENWVWQKNPHVAECLGYSDLPALQKESAALQQAWSTSAAKPDRPKETLEAVLKKRCQPRSTALYRKLASRVSVSGCTDPAFTKLRDTLRHWFPRPPSER